MSTPTDYAVVTAMEIFGGDFVRTLAQLCQRADHENYARIKATWPEYWQEYSEIARSRAERGEGPR